MGALQRLDVAGHLLPLQPAEPDELLVQAPVLRRVVDLGVPVAHVPDQRLGLGRDVRDLGRPHRVVHRLVGEQRVVAVVAERPAVGRAAERRRVPLLRVAAGCRGGYSGWPGPGPRRPCRVPPPRVRPRCAWSRSRLARGTSLSWATNTQPSRKMRCISRPNTCGEVYTLPCTPSSRTSAWTSPGRRPASCSVTVMVRTLLSVAPRGGR